MKKSLSTLIYLLIAVPILFIGCKKNEMTDETISYDNSAKQSIVPGTPAYCGIITTANLYDYGNKATSYGTVTVGNDANNIYVTYTLTGDWTLLPQKVEFYDGCYLFVGTQAELEAMSPKNYDINSSDFTGHFDFRDFKHYIPVAAGEKTYMYTIPRSEITVDCPMIVAFAGITNGTDNMYVSARSLLKGMGYWFTHCIQECKCETAYARGTATDGSVYCFYNSPLHLNNWGWSNKLVQPGPTATQTLYDFEWPIYAGNPSCDGISSHLVGYFKGTYDGTTLHVMYDLSDGFELSETHLWVDDEIMYKNKQGKYVATPGQYTYNNMFEEGVYKDFPVSGTIYIAAHAVVCGPYGW